MNSETFLGQPWDLVLVESLVVLSTVATVVKPRLIVSLSEATRKLKSWAKSSLNLYVLALLLIPCDALAYEVQYEYKVVTSASVLLLVAAIIVGISLHKKYKAYIDWFTQAAECTKYVKQQPMELTREEFNQLDEHIQFVSTQDSAVDEEVRHRWNEFRANVHDNKHGEKGIYNSKRPNEFFNTTDGSIEPTFYGLSYSTFPAYFVTIGLLATFLSLALVLINAGHEINTLFDQKNSFDAEQYNEKLTLTIIGALGTASSKFIISIIGLVSSLALSVSYNSRQNALIKSIHRFIKEVESRLVIAQPRDQEQLAKLENIARGFGELKAGLGDSLGNSLKTAIVEGFSNAETSLRELSTSVITVNEEMKGITTELQSFKKELALSLHSVLESVSLVSKEFSEKSSGLINDVKENANEISEKLRENSKAIGAELGKAHDAISSNVTDIIGKFENLTVKVSASVDDITTSLQSSSKDVRENLQDTEKQFQKLSQSMSKVVTNYNDELAPSINDLVAKLASSGDTVKESIDKIQTAFVEAEGTLTSSINTLSTEFVTNVAIISRDLNSTSLTLTGCSEELGKNIKAAQYAFSDASEAFAKSEHNMNNRIQELNVFGSKLSDGASVMLSNLRTMNTNVKQLAAVIEGLHQKTTEIDMHNIK